MGRRAPHVSQQCVCVTSCCQPLWHANLCVLRLATTLRVLYINMKRPHRTEQQPQLPGGQCSLCSSRRRLLLVGVLATALATLVAATIIVATMARPVRFATAARPSPLPSDYRYEGTSLQPPARRTSSNRQLQSHVPHLTPHTDHCSMEQTRIVAHAGRRARRHCPP